MFGGVEILEHLEADDAFQLELFECCSDQIAEDFIPNRTHPFERISALSAEISAWRKMLMAFMNAPSAVKAPNKTDAITTHIVSADTKGQRPAIAHRPKC